MTNEEYDKMFQNSKKSVAETQQTTKDNTQVVEEHGLKKLNLRTLKGAFMVLLLGYALSVVAFLLENLKIDCGVICGLLGKGLGGFIGGGKCVVVGLWNYFIVRIVKMIMFKYSWN